MQSPDKGSLPVTGIEEILGLKQDGPKMEVGPEPGIEAKLKYGGKLHGEVLNRVTARLKMAKDSVQ
jgi:hypothetical protein